MPKKKTTEDPLVTEMISKGYVIKDKNGKYSCGKEPPRTESEPARKLFTFMAQEQIVKRFTEAMEGK